MALFITTLAHDHGEEGQVDVAGKVGVLDGVRLENGGAEKEYMGEGDLSLWCDE